MVVSSSPLYPLADSSRKSDVRWPLRTWPLLRLRGAGYASRHPFLVAVPRDLFRFALFGTLSVLVIDSLKSWTRSWSAIWSLVPGLQRGADKFLGEMGRCLGFVRRFGPTSNLGEARDECDKLASILANFRSTLDETWSSDAPELLSSDYLKNQWDMLVGEPPSDPAPDFEQMTGTLCATLDELRRFTSPATSAEIANCLLALADMQRALPDAQAGLRSLFRQEHMLEKIERGRLLVKITPCWVAVVSLMAVLHRVKIEGEKGREFPGSRVAEL